MKIFDINNKPPKIIHPALTIGTFDGVHVGHQKIISLLNKAAQEINGESVLFTFFPHPRTVIFPDSHDLKLIQTQEEKLDKLKRFGLQNIVIHQFTKEFSRLSAELFIRDCLVNEIGAEKIIIGYNHQFGKNREGSFEELQALAPIYEFQVEEIPAQEIDEVGVSSTKIRNALSNGDISIANKFLMEPFQLNGIVVKGNQLGRTIGFPTANVFIEDEFKLIPKTGVYLVRCKVDEVCYFGMMNIGFRPTIEGKIPEKPIIEVNLFDFTQTIYNKKISIELLSYLRDETKFSSVESLKSQLIEDEKNARHISNNFSLEQFSL